MTQLPALKMWLFGYLIRFQTYEYERFTGAISVEDWLSADLVVGTVWPEDRPAEQQTGWTKAVVLRLSRVERTQPSVTAGCEAGGHRMIRVLVVEDGYNIELAAFFDRWFFLKRVGDGFAALQALAHESWDVILLDMCFDRAERLLGEESALLTRMGGDRGQFEPI